MIRIRGARVHNLQNVDLDIPRDRLVVITGPSGSGKSSLAFDTLYAEGQRQYIESLSVYARQFLHQMERPDVDLIEGLQPTICIDQRPGNAESAQHGGHGHRDLRLPAAADGPAGRAALLPVRRADPQQTAEQILETLAALPEGTKLMILAPLVRGRAGKHKEVFGQDPQGGLRARADRRRGVRPGQRRARAGRRRRTTSRRSSTGSSSARGSHARLAESMRLAIRHGEGVVIACYQDARCVADGRSAESEGWRDRLFSTLYACPAARSATRSSSRARSASTAPTARARGATAWAVRSVRPGTGAARSGAVAGRRGRRALERSVTPRPQEALPRLSRVLQRAALRGTRRWRNSGRGVSDVAARRRPGFPGVLTLLEKEYATTTASRRASSNWRVSRPGRLPRLPADRGCGPRPIHVRRRQGDPRDHGGCRSARPVPFFAASSFPARERRSPSRC
jgi:excinuclease ABC subunit A